MKYVWELIKKDNMSKSAAFKKAYEKYPKKAAAKESDCPPPKKKKC